VRVLIGMIRQFVPEAAEDIRRRKGMQGSDALRKHPTIFHFSVQMVAHRGAVPRIWLLVCLNVDRFLDFQVTYRPLRVKLAVGAQRCRSLPMGPLLIFWQE
jgi:hypothetical protein